MAFVGKSRVIGTSVALAAAAAAIAGCGSSHSTAAHASVANTSAHIGSSAITQAADLSGAAKGEKVAYSLTEQLPSIGKLSVTGTGAFNTSPQQGETSFDISVPGLSSLGSEASALSNLPLTLVVDNQTLYAQLPSALASKVSSYTGGKSWVSLDLARLAASSQIPGLSNLLSGQTSPTNPAAALKELEAASSTGITKVGPAKVDGVATTEYRATLNLAKLSTQLPAAQRKALKQGLARASKQLGSTTIPFDVYIDSAHLIRRLTLNYTYEVQSTKVPLTMQLDFLSYGQQSAPTVPAASDTFDATSLLSMYGSAFGSASSSTLGG